MKKKTLLTLLGIVSIVSLGTFLLNNFYPVTLSSYCSFDDVTTFENMNMVINETDYTKFDGDPNSIVYKAYRTRKKEDIVALLKHIGNLETTLVSEKPGSNALAYADYTYSIRIHNYDQDLKDDSILINYLNPRYIVILGNNGKKRTFKFSQGDIDLDFLQRFLQKMDCEIIE